jgi:hypothetical protein
MFIRLTGTIIAFILASFLVYLGFEVINGHVGLNPFVAFPFALAAALAPILMYEHCLEELELDIDSLEGQCDSLISTIDEQSGIINNHVCKPNPNVYSSDACLCDVPHCGPCYSNHKGPCITLEQHIRNDYTNLEATAR